MVKPFDTQTLYCVVKARLDLGEDPKEIFEELKNCQVVDISSLGMVLGQLRLERGSESDSEGPKRGTLYHFMHQPTNKSQEI